MYSREAARTEEDEEGERTQERVTMTAAGMCMTGVGASQPDLMLMFPLMIDAGWQFPFSCWELKLIQLILILTSFVMSAVIWMTHSSLFLIPSCLLSWFGLFVFSFLFWPFQQLDTSPCYFPRPPAVINHWIWSFLCVCVCLLLNEHLQLKNAKVRWLYTLSLFCVVSRVLVAPRGGLVRWLQLPSCSIEQVWPESMVWKKKLKQKKTFVAL